MDLDLAWEMKRRKPKYTDALRAEAVRLVLEEGGSVADVAKALGMRTTTLAGWLNAHAGSDSAARLDATD